MLLIRHIDLYDFVNVFLAAATLPFVLIVCPSIAIPTQIAVLAGQEYYAASLSLTLSATVALYVNLIDSLSLKGWGIWDPLFLIFFSESLSDNLHDTVLQTSE